MSASTDGFVPVRGRGGMLRLTAMGWRYFAPESLLLPQPVGDLLHTDVLTESDIKRYFGTGAVWDGFEVTA